MIRPKAFAIVLAALLATVSTLAEARRPQEREPSAGAARAGVFDYYLLTLSWSPTYCLTHQGDRQQCGGTKGLGLVLHGLWPQYASGGWPENCATSERLSPEAKKFGRTLFPNEKLIHHEWDRHGTCSGFSALEYFRKADLARTGIKVPPAFEAPARTQAMSADEIAGAFAALNPGLRLVVRCSGPELNELQFCLDRNLKATSCGKGVRSNCRPGPIRVPAVR